jgi:predicted outer membrane protein
MSASPRLRIGVVAAGLCCLLLGYAIAQQQQPAGQTRTRERDPSASGQTDRSSPLQIDRSTAERRTANYRGAQANASGANRAVEHYLANCLLARNEAEVQLSEIAQQKAENPDVKQFAQQMIQDHRKLIEKLQPLAGMQGSAKRGASDSSTTRSSDTTALPGSPGAGQTIPPSGISTTVPPTGTTADAAASTTTREMSGGGALHQLGQIERQIGERCLQMARDELQQKSGAEFDKCYVGSAIGAHMQVLAALEVIGQQTQGQLAQVAQQAQPAVQEHLDKAKQLAKQLEGPSGPRGSQAERQSTRTER